MKISIVTPTFNSEKYLSETIESIIYQSGNFEIEYILVDGLSSDGTDRIIKSYKDKLELNQLNIKCTKVTMHYIREKDKGMYDAIAKGFERATGEVIAYLNSDDYYLPNAFLGISQIFDNFSGITWLTGKITVYNENGNIIKSYLPYIYSRDLIRKGVYGTELPFIQQESCFWRKSLLEKVDLEKFALYKLAGDFFLWHEFAKYEELRIVDSPLSGFRTHDGNKSNDIEAYYEEFNAIVGIKKNLLDRFRIKRHKFYWAMGDDKKKARILKKFSHMSVVTIYGDWIKERKNTEIESIKKNKSSDEKEVNGTRKIEKKISVVIGSYNRLPLLKLCVEAVRKELEGLAYEIIVVDGGSNDGSVDWLCKQKDIITILQHNRGEWKGETIQRRSWGYFMNLGFKTAQGKYICMLSDDSLIVPGAIMNGYNLFEKKLNEGLNIGGVAFYFRDYPIRKKYAVAVNLGHLYVNHGLYLRRALEDVNYISEDEYHFYFADTDLVLKMKGKGYECIPSPTSFVEHYFEATPEIRKSNNDSKKEKDRLHLINKWSGLAYEERKKEYYMKTVGYWDFIETGFSDKNRTINKLINAASID